MAGLPGGTTLLVREMRWEAEDVLALTLEDPDGSELPCWDLGAHIDVAIAPGLIRQYSLCGDPADRSAWRIAVLLEPHGRGGSAFIHQSLRPGMTLEVGMPRCNFPLVEAEEYLFIAGGIGITPLLPMVRAIADRGGRFRMLYGGRKRNSMAFLPSLAELGAAIDIRPEEEFGLLDLAGALERSSGEAAVYCCGPEPLIAALEAACATRGRPAPHVERFAARPVQGDSPSEPASSFEVVLAQSGQRFTIPEDKTIIAVLEEAGIPIITSCTEGFCGICETEVISGIPDHHDDYLTDELRATNRTMMICVGRSKSKELVLKL